MTEILADDAVFPELMSTLEEFGDFAHRGMGRRVYDGSAAHWVESLRLDKTAADGSPRAFKVNLLGLSSVLFAGFDGDDQRTLALTQWQVERALKQRDPDAALTLALFHPPFACMQPADKVCERRLLNQADLVLHGHLHDPETAFVRTGAGSAVVVAAGAAFESQTSRNSFNVVEVDLQTGAGQVAFYKYLPGHHRWNRDRDVALDDPDGVFHFELPGLRHAPVVAPTAPPAIRPTLAPTTVHFVHDVLRIDDFTGRDEEVQRLRVILRGELDLLTGRRASVTALRAVGGMGKSSLAREVVKEVREHTRFEAVVWYGFYEARSDDPAAFFAEVLRYLGQPAGTQATGTARAAQLRAELSSYLDEHAVMLVLDGLEVAQRTGDGAQPQFGHLRDSHQEVARLLSHLCNQERSAALVTTRVPLTDLAGAIGHLDLPLERMSRGDGARLLAALGVEGSEDERADCADLLGGHPLCLRAAGSLLARRHTPARDVGTIIGDAAAWKRTGEGERVQHIVDAHRADLTPEQERFLQLLSLHTRAVGEDNFRVLAPEVPGRGDVWERIVSPLERWGLVEQLPGPPKQVTAHPLMKLAYGSWLDPEGRRRGHERWAKAAAGDPRGGRLGDEGAEPGGAAALAGCGGALPGGGDGGGGEGGVPGEELGETFGRARLRRSGLGTGSTGRRCNGSWPMAPQPTEPHVDIRLHGESGQLAGQ